MSRIIAWFVHNPVAANLLMFVLVAGGFLALPLIHQEEFPSIETDMIRVSTEYPGATPAEVEESVCVRIEEEIDGTPDVDRIRSLAVEGVCVVTIELLMDGNSEIALNEIENRVNSIDTFPDDVERPVVSKLLVRNSVVQVAIRGPADERTLKVLGQEARDELASLPGVSQVTLAYARPYEISIEVSEENLRRHELTLDAVTRAVRGSSLDLPGGSVKTRGGEILLRTVGQAYRGGEFEDIVVLSRPDGTSVKLGEIATIVDGFEDIDLRARFNGEPAVIVQVERIGEEDILEIAGQVADWAADYRHRVPEGISVTLFNDASQKLKIRLDSLLSNARAGILLVVAILALFLRFRLAMWVAAGVPISLLGALMAFPTIGLSISTLAVMAFILVLGILVDDAIVIGESVYTHERRNEDQVQSAIDGTHDVYVPVVFGVMTTVAAFLPLVMMPGHMGRFFSVIGVTAILCLFFSLVESQLILPSHLAYRRTRSRGEPNPIVKRWVGFQERLAGGLERFAVQGYGRALERAIEWRYVTAAAAIGLLILTAALFSSGRMRYQFFPAVEGDVIYASLTMPQGTPIEATNAAIAQLESAADTLRAELDERRDHSIVLHAITSIGKQLARDGPPSFAVNTGGSHIAEVALELIPSIDREETTGEIAVRWRELTGPIPDAVELAFVTDAFSAGSAISVELRGGEVATLTQAAATLRARLATFAGVTDIADSFRGGKQEVRLRLLSDARPLGLTLQDLARQVRQAFYGDEVQRVQRGTDDVRVMARYPDAERRSLGSLEQMRIRTADGVEVPFVAVADATLGRGFATIRRTDRKRVVGVTADVDRSVTTPERVLAIVERELPAMLSAFPGVTYRLAGEQQERGDATEGLLQGAALALLLIYALLAIPLRSYLQPLVIMSVIPFGAVGAILGHLIMGWDVVFFSVLGIVALSGVVVNASLVLVHFVNRQRDAGVPFLEAVRSAGVVRFRPILLTSLTTFIGLVPLMFEAAVPARPLIPMAVSLGYGVLMAAVVTLFLVPCGYVILGDAMRLLGGRGGRERGIAADAAQPARVGMPGTSAPGPVASR